MDDDPFSGLDLRPVSLADQAKFNEYLACLKEPLSDYTFSQLFTWGNSLRILWKELHGHLCVFANGTGDLTMLMPPIGDGPGQRALAEAFAIMDAYNDAHQAHGHSRIEYVSEELLERFENPGIVAEPMGGDYVYHVRRMIELTGGDLASKRQLKNRFIRNYEFRLESYQAPVHRLECLQLLCLWKRQQDAQHQSRHPIIALKRQKETLACELTLECAHELGTEGLVVYTRPKSAVDGADGWSLSGFTFGEALGPGQSSILIEKTDLRIRGLPQFIFSEFCRQCWAQQPLVNVGDDWGLETLAWTKMSYRPVRIMRKYTLQQASRTVVQLPATACVPTPVNAVAKSRSTVLRQ